jgi:hypothetical protein
LASTREVADNFVINVEFGNVEGMDFYVICCSKILHTVNEDFEFEWGIEFVVGEQIIISKYDQKWGNSNGTYVLLKNSHVATPLWAKCEGEAHTPKSGKLESSGIPKNLELDCRGQISSHLSVLGVIEKVLNCRCQKWPRMSHLDIYSPSYGQKKGRESN